ncbi:MAG: hypothetical protein V4591_02035 [Bdellovibrionota bacterium]
MKGLKVFLHLEEKILEIVKAMVEQNFVLVDKETQCDVFLTDVYTIKHQGPVNILVVDSTKLPEFKGVDDLLGFEHYVIFNEMSFLEERIRKALLRHEKIMYDQKNDDNYTGVNALIDLKDTTLENGYKLPLIRHFVVKSSSDRKLMAEYLEKFFEEIETISGFKNPVVVQYAIEIQEELLMNAIWDANPKHSQQFRSIPVELLPEEEVTLQWAFNGKELAISVKDPFGRMDPEVMEKYISFIFRTGKSVEHSLNNQQKVSAGLGMYMIIQRANLLSVFICSGRITDVGVVLIIKEGKRSSAITSKAIDIIKV